MHVSRLAPRRRGRGCSGRFTALAASAAASTKWADLRVVTHTGRTLAELRQYTGSTTVRASTEGDCFGSPGTGKRFTMGDANALGIVKDALESDHALSPLVLTDAFVDELRPRRLRDRRLHDGRVQLLVPRVNHVTSSTGASRRPSTTATRSSGTSPRERADPARELVLSAPAG